MDSLSTDVLVASAIAARVSKIWSGYALFSNSTGVQNQFYMIHPTPEEQGTISISIITTLSSANPAPGVFADNDFGIRNRCSQGGKVKQRWSVDQLCSTRQCAIAELFERILCWICEYSNGQPEGAARMRPV